MKFQTLAAILTFCGGATFTLVDIGTDVSLALEYWNSSNYVDGSSSRVSTNNNAFALFTTMWIGLGGLVQSLLVLCFLCCGNARLKWLPNSIKVCLFLFSPILLAPVIANLYGAIYIISNPSKEGIQEDINRFEINNPTQKSLSRL